MYTELKRSIFAEFDILWFLTMEEGMSELIGKAADIIVSIE